MGLGSSKRKFIAAIGKNKVGIIAESFGPVTDGFVKLKTIYSAISPGTEKKTIAKEVPSFTKHWDNERRIFLKEGTVKKFPAGLGYSLVAKIEASKNDKFFVWLDAPHSDYNLVEESRAKKYLIPGNVDPKSVVFLPFVRIALGAVHDANIRVGDNVVVMGLGLIGNLVSQIAALNGANVLGVDIDTSRVKLAKKVGINAILNDKKDISLFIKEKYFPGGADRVVEASGSYESLNSGIRVSRIAGKVITVASYPTKTAAMALGEEWQKNKISLFSSMTVNDCPHPEFPFWDLDRLNRTALNLIVSKKVNVLQLITDIFNFEDYKKAYKKLSEKSSSLGILFKYK